MSAAPPLSRQVLRRKPTTGITDGHGTGHDLKRSIGTFQLTMFGVGSTIGTGIFFVLSVAVPDAGPAVLLAFVGAGIAAGLSAICYAELASTIPASGSTYSYAYAALGEMPAMGIAACLLLEYGVSASAVAVGWSEYLNELFQTFFGHQLPYALSHAPGSTSASGAHGVVNLPAVVLVAMCTVLLVRGASESARANAIMVVTKLAVLAFFAVVAFTAFDSGHFHPFLPLGAAGVSTAAGAIFFSFIGLDSVSTAGEEVKDPQRTMPRAIIAALVVVVTFYLLVTAAALGAQDWHQFDGQEAGLAQILNDVVGSDWPGTILAAGAVISIFSVTLVTLYGQSRILFAMGRDGMLPQRFATVNPRTLTPTFNTIVVASVVSVLAALIPLDELTDVVSIGTLTAFIVVALGVIILRRTAPHLSRGFRVPGYPVTPVLAIAACLYVMWGLRLVTWVVFGIWVCIVLAFYLLWGRHHSALNDPPDPDPTPRPEPSAEV